MGLAAVGGADVENKPALHLPCPGVFQLRLLLDGLFYALLDGLGHIEQLVGPLQGVGQEITADALHPQHVLQGVHGQARREFQVLPG